MAASPRDLLKPLSQRMLEIAQAVQQQTGRADGQAVLYGGTLAVGGTTTQLAISDCLYSMAGTLLVMPAVTAQVLTGSSIPTLSAGQSCNVLVEIDNTQPTPVVTLTPGAVTTGTPVTPSPNAGRIVLGYLALTGAFTPGTTALTAPMCVTLAYSAGNVNPAGTQGPTGSSGGF